MTLHKDFKRLVRARMQKTGESYTAARAQLLDKTPLGHAGRAVPAAGGAGMPASPATGSTRPAAMDYASIAGKSDRILKAKTGCTWERWVHALDAHGGETMTHREVVDLVHTKYKVGGWWSQMVTVGYERIKGKRAAGQRLDGSYEASKSRTFDVPVATLFQAFADPRKRRRWLKVPRVTMRTATPPKSIRLGFPDGGIVAIWFTPKGSGKSSVALAQGKLPDKETAGRIRDFWAERLESLATMLRT